MWKKILFVIALGLLLPTCLRAQDGFVSDEWNDPATGSSFSIGQVFALNFFDAGYANEGLQHSFLYRGADTLLYEKSAYDVIYRTRDRRPGHATDYAVGMGLTPALYLLPTRGLDSLIDVMAYGVTFTRDTSVVAPYSQFFIPLVLHDPTLEPGDAPSVIQYYNDAPSLFPTGTTTPVLWTFKVANRTLTHTQNVVIGYPPCGSAEGLVAEDYEHNIYDAVRVGPYCWTKQNLKSARYWDGTPVDNPMTYVSDMYPDAADNFNLYGYLYTWNDATRTANNTTLTSDTIDGICPAGWRVPTAAEMAYLGNYAAASLKTDYDWMNGLGTNTTAFSALPAGLYSGLRFENIKGETGFWSCTQCNPTASNALMLSSYCSESLVRSQNNTLGLSVRCIKK